MFKKKGFFDSGSSNSSSNSNNSNSNSAEDGDIAELKKQISKLEEQVKIQKEIKLTLLEEHSKEIELLSNEKKELSNKVASLTAENESLKSNFEKLKGILDAPSEERVVLYFGSKSTQDSVVQGERASFCKFIAYEKQRIDNILLSLKGIEAKSAEAVKKADAWSGFRDLNDAVTRLAVACEKVRALPEVEKALADVPAPPKPEEEKGEGGDGGKDSEQSQAQSTQSTETVEKKLGSITDLVNKQNELLLKLKSNPK